MTCADDVESPTRSNDPNKDREVLAAWSVALWLAGDDCRDKLGKVKQWVEAQK